MIFDNFKLQQKILLGYSLPILALLTATIWGAWTTHKVAKHFQQVTIMSGLTDKVHHLQLAHLQMSNGVRGYLLQPKVAFLEQDRRGEVFFQNTLTDLNQEQYSLDNLAQYFSPARIEQFTELKRHVEQVNEMIVEYDRISNRMVILTQQGKPEQADQLFAQQAGEEINQEFVLLNQNLHQMYQDLVVEDTEVVNRLLKQLIQGLILLAVGLGGLAGLALWFIASRLTQTINQTATQITSSTREIMVTVEQQSASATAQASSVHETTTTMEELERSAQVSAEQARKASEAAHQALQLTEQGNQVVTETLTGMSHLQEKVGAIAQQIARLSEQNQQIGTISQLVSTLSTQTNMLALNASIEAVRAGEAGQGFAVVANEIRKLADESQHSATQINHLVKEIQSAVSSTVLVADEGTNTVTQGISLVEDTVQVFTGMQEAVDEVVLSNQQIALNVQQQVQAVQQVVSAMTSLNQGARETAQGIQQTQSETEHLEHSAQVLLALV